MYPARILTSGPESCCSARGITLVTIFLLVFACASASRGQSPAFVAPPRTIADIAAALEQEKADPAIALRLRAQADAAPRMGLSKGELAEFYWQRGGARANLGRFREALADSEKAVELGQGNVDLQKLGNLRQFNAMMYSQAGEPRKSLEVLYQIAREADKPGNKGRAFNNNRMIVERLVLMGDFSQAEAYLRKTRSLMQEAHSWPQYNSGFRSGWERDLQMIEAKLLEARGRLREAEAAYRRAETIARRAVDDRLKMPNSPPRLQLEQVVDSLIASQGRMKARQGRLAEAEADVRRALLNRLKVTGKDNLDTANYLSMLSSLLVEQARYSEAESLTRSVIDIYNRFGVPTDSQGIATALNALATILNLQGRWPEAAQLFAQVDQATSKWDPARRDALTLSGAHVTTMYNVNNLSAGLTAAERLVARQKVRFGEQSLETALARGMWAMGLVRANRDAEALREFKAALPALIAASVDADVDDTTERMAREQRIQGVIEAYMVVLARTGGPTVAVETFRLADLVRGRSVQRAVAASSARGAAGSPGLAELVRKQQDLQKQIDAQLGALNNLLAAPPSERDEKAVNQLRADVDKLRPENLKAKQEIGRRFPKYAELIEPSPASTADIQSVLRNDETLVSFYFGIRRSFVWAVPKDGPVAFAAIPATAADIEGKVNTLRRALEPNGATIGDIPTFDVELAHELYTLLLAPVLPAWQPAKNLIVVTNGGVGLLPLSLLATKPIRPEATAEPLFSGYRDVPWLARSHAVTTVPSAAALVMLRRLAAASSKRQPFVGFGDPLFSVEQEKEDAAGRREFTLLTSADLTTRGLPLRRRAALSTRQIASAELAQLPRLPDTAEELRAIALALGTDPAKTLRLGKEANERQVKSSALASYRIVAFATHGLAPGDLNGLTQPALALTAPEIAGVEGDGLLTLDEILALKLDADWVVLSACNTAAGAGAGAQAASGLARAFFYAGTRALLVTNWSVHSQSARELTTDIFRRQAADPNLGRSEALRQAMMTLADGPGFTDGSGKTLFSYAHPLFWAPYTILGDGG